MTNGEADDRGGGPDFTVKSKSQRKRDHQAVQALAARLAELPRHRLETLGIDEAVCAALIEAHAMQRGARKRQLRYAAGLLAGNDVARIEAALEHQDQPRAEAVAAFHAVEAWRDALVAGDDDVIEQLAARFPTLDRGRLVRLTNDARRARDSAAAPRAGRRLFRYLKEFGGN